MTPVCRYRHRVYFEDYTTPELRQIQDGRGQTIAWQCPVCLRSWRDRPGEVGHELVPLDVRTRRRALIEAADATLGVK